MHTPPIILVDGVWVAIQYTQDAYRFDQAGHRRQCRYAEDRVILTAMALTVAVLRKLMASCLNPSMIRK